MQLPRKLIVVEKLGATVKKCRIFEALDRQADLTSHQRASLLIFFAAFMVASTMP